MIDNPNRPTPPDPTVNVNTVDPVVRGIRPGLNVEDKGGPETRPALARRAYSFLRQWGWRDNSGDHVAVGRHPSIPDERQRPGATVPTPTHQPDVDPWYSSISPRSF